MAENLNYRGTEPDTLGVCYDNDPANCTTYGRLYNWFTAKDICPSGWHLSSNEEWTTLMNFVGKTDRGKKLKANSSLWSTNTGTDIYGFSALPGGYKVGVGGFSFVGKEGRWWTATEFQANNPYYRFLENGEAGDVNRGNGGANNLYSVRCVKD